MIRIIATSRALPWALGVTAALAVVTAYLGRTTITFSIAFPPTKLALSDLCGIVCATVVGILARPRMWEWERVAGTDRARNVSAAVAVLGIVLPMTCVAVLVPQLHGLAPWGFIVTNAAVLAALVQLLAPVIGPLWSGLCVLGAWFVAGFAQHIEPGLIAVLPISTYPAAQSSPLWALALALAAIIVHARTYGSVAARRRDD